MSSGQRQRDSGGSRPSTVSGTPKRREKVRPVDYFQRNLTFTITFIPYDATIQSRHRQRTRQGLSLLSMKYTVQLHGVPVGRSDLERCDPQTGFARGAFNPATGYQLVQDVFRLYSEAVPDTPGRVADPEKLQRYYKARDALGLDLIGPDGEPVTGATVHVYEQPRGAGGLELEVHIADPAFWNARQGEGR